MSYSTPTYPYDTIVRLTDTIGGVNYSGSGVLISPDEVLTASHLVYHTGVGTASGISVTPGYEFGSSPYGSEASYSYHYNPIDDTNDFIRYAASQSDYAVLHLSQGFASAGYMGILTNFGGGAVTISGYPVSANGAQVNSFQYVFQRPGYSLLETSPLGPGSSGGPAWVEGANGPDVVGLVSSGDGVTGNDPIITTAAFDQIEAWVSQDEGAVTAPLDADISTLYETVLGRAPDSSGLTGVVDDVAAGTTLVQLRPAFANSAEAQGDLESLYQSVLGRGADAGGLADFTNALATTTSLAGVRADLATSPEAEGDLQGLYQAVLGRGADAGGLAAFTNALATTTPLAGVRADLATSPEARGNIESLYQTYLGRPADPTGLAGWTNALATGTSLADIRMDIAASPEAQAHGAPGSVAVLQSPAEVSAAQITGLVADTASFLSVHTVGDPPGWSAPLAPTMTSMTPARDLLPLHRAGFATVTPPVPSSGGAAMTARHLAGRTWVQAGAAHHLTASV